MFDQFKQITSILKHAGELRSRAEQLKGELERTTLEAESSDGAVHLTLNGKGRVLSARIEPAALAAAAGDPAAADRLDQSLAEAFNQAHDQVQQLLAEKIKEATGGMDLPRLDNMLG